MADDRTCPACGASLGPPTPEAGPPAAAPLRLPPAHGEDLGRPLPPPDAPPVEVMDFGFRSARMRLRICLGFLAAWAVTDVVAIALEIFQVRLAHRAVGGLGTLDEATANDARIGRVGVALIVLFAGAAISWLMWQYRAQANLSFLRVEDLSYSPAWAIGSWFVPIANLVYPYWATSELSGASTQDRPARAPWRERLERFDWRVLRSPALAWWWGTFVLGGILVRVADVVGETADSAGQILAGAYLFPLGHVLLLAAAALAALVSQQIQDGQEGTWRDLRLRVAGGDAPPGP